MSSEFYEDEVRASAVECSAACVLLGAIVSLSKLDGKVHVELNRAIGRAYHLTRHTTARVVSEAISNTAFMLLDAPDVRASIHLQLAIRSEARCYWRDAAHALVSAIKCAFGDQAPLALAILCEQTDIVARADASEVSP